MFNGITVESEIEALSKRVEVKRLLDEYLEYGGFPEVALSDKKARKKMLLDYVEDIITKDVAERHKVKEKEKLRSLARYYLTNTSTKISFNKLKNLLSIPLRTVERFSYYLEESYLVLFLKRFSFKVREQDKSARKVYSIDVGLSNALGFKFSQDLGRIMENTVFLELIKKNSGNPDFEIYYWQNPQQQEVDFIVKYGRHVKQIIQVCRNIHDPDAKKRELRALLKASVELKCSNLLVITEDREGEEKTQQKKIKYIPLWKWLLQSQQTM
jgi:predicted AAA+ superfamily ATPase